MTLTQRRLLFYSFIFLFILIAPFAILYATGRTINWGNLEIQRTGSLVIESEPSGAEVFLNDKRPTAFLQKVFGRATVPRTTARLINLAPGTYHLRLQTPNYFPWEEEINIRPNEVTNIGPVHLFKAAQPELVYPLPASSQLFISPDKQRIFSSETTSVNFIDFSRHQEASIPLTNSQPLSVEWSLDSRWALLNEQFITDANGKIIVDSKKLTGYTPSFWRWDSLAPDIIYFVDQEILYRLELTNQNVTPVLDFQPLLTGRLLVDYKPSARHMYLILTSSQGPELLTIDPDKPAKQNSVTLPPGHYQFLKNQDKTLLFEKNKQILYLIDQPLPLFLSPRITSVATDYSVGRWDGNSLFYATPLEIRRWDNNQENLIGRFGEPIVDLAFNANRQVLLTATTAGLTLRPATNRPYSQTTKLLDVANLTNLLSVSNSNLYFVGTVNDQTGIFSLEY